MKPNKSTTDGQDSGQNNAVQTNRNDQPLTDELGSKDIPAAPHGAAEFIDNPVLVVAASDDLFDDDIPVPPSSAESPEGDGLAIDDADGSRDDSVRIPNKVDGDADAEGDVDDDLGLFEDLRVDRDGEASPPAKSDVVDPIGEAQISEIIGRVLDSRKRWTALDQRGHRYVYLMLGEIYAACPRITKASRAMYALVRALKEDVPNVGKKGQWRDPFEKTPQEIFLAMIFGIKTRRSTKSDWKKTLEAADVAGVERQRDAFAKWITAVGGIEGAMETLASRTRGDPVTAIAKKKEQMLDIAAELQSVDPEAEPFLMSQPPDGEDLPEGIGLAWVIATGKRGLGTIEVQPIELISDRNLIIRTFDAWKRSLEMMMKESESSLRSKMRERRPAFRRAMQYDKKHNEFKGTLDDYIEQFPKALDDDRSGLSYRG